MKKILAWLQSFGQGCLNLPRLRLELIRGEESMLVTIWGPAGPDQDQADQAFLDSLKQEGWLLL